MADDNRLELELTADTTQSDAAIEKTNKAWASVAEQAAAKGQIVSASLDGYVGSIVKSTQNSSKAALSAIERVERQAELAGKTGVDRLRVQQQQLIATLGTDEAAIQRVTAAYEKLIQAKLKSYDISSRVSKPDIERPDLRNIQALEPSQRAAQAAAFFADKDLFGTPEQIKQSADNAAKFAADARAKAEQQFRSRGNDPDIPENREAAAAKIRAARDAEVARATQGVDKLVNDSQARQLSGAQRIEAERQRALQSLGKTEELQKRINTHFDDTAKKFADGQFASNIKNFVQNPLQSAGNLAETFFLSLGRGGAIAIGLGLTLGALSLGAKSLADSFSQESVEAYNLSIRTGLSTEKTQLFSRAADIAGVNANTLSIAVRTLSRGLLEGSEGSVHAKVQLDLLGIAARDAATGGLRSMDELLPEILRKLSAIPDQAEKVRAAQILLGRGGQELLPLAESYDKLQEAIKATGVIIDEEGIAKAREYRETVKLLGDEWDAFKHSIAETVVATVQIIVKGREGLRSLGPDIQELEKRFKPRFDVEDAYLRGEPTSESRSLHDRRREFLKNEADASKAAVAEYERANHLAGEHLKELTATSTKLLTERGEYIRRTTNPQLSAPDRADAFAKVKQLDAENEVVKKQIEAAKLSNELPRLGAEAVRHARQFAEQAAASEAGGIAAINIERKKLLEQLGTKIGAEGTEFKIGVPAAARALIDEGTQDKIRKETRKTQEEIRKLQAQTGTLILEDEKRNLSARETAEADVLAGLEARELIGRREVEAQRLETHRETLRQIAAIDINVIEDANRREIQEYRERAKREGVAVTDSAAHIAALRATAVEKEKQVGIGVVDARNHADQELTNARLNRDREYADKSRDYAFETETQRVAFGRNTIGAEKAQQLDNLQLIHARTLQGREALEAAKLRIETDSLKALEQLELASIDRRTAEDIRKSTDAAVKRGETLEQSIKQARLITERGEQEKLQLAIATNNAIAEAARKTAIDNAKLIEDNNKGIFEGLKSEFDRFYDAATGKGKSFATELGAALKNILQTSVRDAITGTAAAELTSLITGQQVAVRREAAGAGPLGPVAALFGYGRKIEVGSPELAIEKLTQGNALRVIVTNPVSAPAAVAPRPATDESGSREAVDNAVGKLTGTFPGFLEKASGAFDEVLKAKQATAATPQATTSTTAGGTLKIPGVGFLPKSVLDAVLATTPETTIGPAAAQLPPPIQRPIQPPIQPSAIPAIPPIAPVVAPEIVKQATEYATSAGGANRIPPGATLASIEKVTQGNALRVIVTNIQQSTSSFPASIEGAKQAVGGSHIPGVGFLPQAVLAAALAAAPGFAGSIPGGAPAGAVDTTVSYPGFPSSSTEVFSSLAGGTTGGFDLSQLLGAPGGTSGFAGPVSGYGEPVISGPSSGLTGLGRPSSLARILGSPRIGGDLGGLLAGLIRPAQTINQNVLNNGPGINDLPFGGISGGPVTPVDILNASIPQGFSQHYLSLLSRLKDSFFNKEAIVTGPGRATTAAGIGGLKGNLAGIFTSQGAANLEIAAGLPLATAGIFGRRQGTGLGIAEATLGGALTGAGIGTLILPGIGTAIGAGVGAAVGLGIGLGEKLFGVESQVNEAKRLVAQLYGGLKIDTSFAQQIVDVANSKYSRHVSIAVRDPDIRKALELYAASRGQQFPLSAATPRGASFVEQNGQLFQQAGSLYGQQFAFNTPGNLPILGGSAGVGSYPNPGGGSTGPTVGPTYISLNVGDKAAAAFMTGQFVTPEFVQTQYSNSIAQSNGRVQNSAALQVPGLITS